jgi:hypothetical protein
LVGLYGGEEKIGLRYAVGANTKVVSAPEKACGERLGTIGCVHGVVVLPSLRGLVNHADNARILGGSEIDLAIVVRQIDDNIGSRH